MVDDGEDRLSPRRAGIFRLSEADRAYYDRDDRVRFRFRANALLVGIVLYVLLSGFDVFAYPEFAATLVSIRLVAAAAMALCYLFYLRCGSRAGREGAVIVYGTSAIVGLIVQGLVDMEAVSFFNFGAAIALFYGGATLFARPAVVLLGALSVVLAYAVSLPFTEQNVSLAVVDRILILITLAMIVLSNLFRDRLERAQHADAEALIRARRDAEAALERALSADRAKDNLLAGVSHELRTPMNAIIGFSDAIRTEVFGPLQPAPYRDYVEHIHSSGLILRRNIDDLLDLSSSSMGKMGFEETRFSLAEAAAGAVSLCAYRAAEDGIALTLEGAGNDVTVEADRQRLEQAIINLVTNAIKFSRHGQTVTVALHPAGEAGATVSVRDDGCGIAPDALGTIADPFVQQQGDRQKSGYGGLGIGLAIVTNIMDTIGGSLEIRSEEGQGTVASLLIPRRRIVGTPPKTARAVMRVERRKAV